MIAIIISLPLVNHNKRTAVNLSIILIRFIVVCQNFVFSLPSVQAVLHDRNHLFHVSIRNEPLMKYSQAARRIVWMSRNLSSPYFLRKYQSNYSNSFSSRSIWIALAAFSFFSSITFAYICVVFTLVCPNILLTV